jgi:transglutaminase-like putative cysteine protease
MRSSVVESSPASRPAGVQSQRHQYQPPYPPHKSYSPRPTSKRLKGTSERSLVLAPAEGWLVLVLLAVAVYCVVFSISQLGWVGNTFILNWSATAGLVVGLIVAKIEKFPQVILHMAACLVGHWLSIWLVSAFALHVAWTLLIAKIGTIISDPTNFNRSDMVFLFYLSFLSFFLGYYGAWLIYRAHLAWLVAMVYASILLINLSYIPHDLAYLVAIQVTALILLIARAQLGAKLLQWKSEGLYTDRTWLRGITLRFMQLASVMVLLTLLISWLLPVLEQPSAGGTFWNYLNNIWSNVLQGNISWQDPSAVLHPYQAPTNFFGDQLTISGSVHLPKGEVLDYTSTAAPQYLAGFSYDHFDGHTWTSLANANSQNYDVNTPLPTDETTSFKEAKTSVTIVQPPDETKHFVFGPPQPSAFDKSTVIYGTSLVSAWAQESALSKGEHYQVTSLLPTASSTRLAAIPLPHNDPDQIWKKDPYYTPLQASYMQVPALPSQVLQTTRQWTQGATSAYRALQMLEAHLSDTTQFTYSQDNPAIPSNVDAISWLLQTHRGYCTYYATAMTIMARQLGIPARMMNGFSHGHFDTQRKVWVVDGSDAHSWVQAFFPGLGWLNFDPTPGYSLSGNGTTSPRPATTPVPMATTHPTLPQAKGTPPTKKKITPPLPPTASGNGSTANTNGAENILFGVSMVVLLCSIVLFLVAVARYWWRGLYADSMFIAATFWRLCRMASWVGLAPRRWQTPYEYSRILCQRVPQEAGSLWRLTELFVRERWAPVSQTPYVMTNAELRRIWPDLRRIFVRLLWMKAQKR